MALKDYHNTSDDGYVAGYSTISLAQTFTASSSYSITSVKVLVYRYSTSGSPGTITATIQTVDGSSPPIPTGVILCTATRDGNGFSTGTAGEWQEFVFSSSAALTSGTKYALVLSGGVNATNCYRWRYDASDGYANGNKARFVSGAWASDATQDFLFETYADPIAHEVSGSCGVALGVVGNLTGLFVLSGSSPIALALAGFLSSDIFISGTTGITIGLTAPRLFKLFKRDQTVPLRRLIAAGNNRIFYEVL